MSEPEVAYERIDATVTISLNRAHRHNALTTGICSQVSEMLQTASDDRSVRVVVLTATGTTFCAGTDLKDNFAEGAPPPEANLRNSRHPLLLSIRSLPKPVICAVNGAAAGIGIGLALAGDIVVAHEDASFVLAFTRLGLIPDGGALWFMEKAIGRPRTLKAAMLGETISARRAAEIGLIADCYPADEFRERTRDLARQLSQGPTEALGMLKQSVDLAPGNSLPSQLELEALLQRKAASTADFAEGLNAFHERRKPSFRGE